MNITYIIQARMTSTRLPGKVLMPIDNRPLLWYLVYRVSKYIPLKDIVVATSTESSDDKIVAFCQKNNLQFFRGSLNNVLGRFYQTAKVYSSDVIIRLTADNPLVDGQLVKQGLKVFLEENIDYLSTTLERTFPVGLDFEIFRFQALEEASKNAKDPYELEHVTPYIYKSKPAQFHLRAFKRAEDKSAYRITVDTPQDFKLIKLLISNYQAHEKGAEEIISLLDRHPQLVSNYVK